MEGVIFFLLGSSGEGVSEQEWGYGLVSASEFRCVCSL